MVTDSAVTVHNAVQWNSFLFPSFQTSLKIKQKLSYESIVGWVFNCMGVCREGFITSKKRGRHSTECGVPWSGVFHGGFHCTEVY